MVENQEVKKLLEQWITERQIAGAVVRIDKAGESLCDAWYGYADIGKGILMDRKSIFRLASMTKPVIAIAAMLLEEEGKLDIDAPIETYLPEFAALKAADKVIGFEEFYQADPDNPGMPKMNTGLIENIRETDLKRSVTVRDILSHSSGMGQGPVSMQRLNSEWKPEQSLQERVSIISKTLLDFQPGDHTGYSASTAYDVLGRMIEVVSGMNLDAFVKERICKPLKLRDTGFVMNEEQEIRIVRLYEAADGKLTDVSDSEEFWKLINPMAYGYYSGSAGMLGTVEDYSKIARMFLQNGTVDGQPFLHADTVSRMRQEASVKHLEMQRGIVWGMGMEVIEDPGLAGKRAGKGTFGWSGAYGTHFYVDVENKLTVVLGVNRSNIGGADSELSRLLEEVVYREFICSDA